MKLLGEFGLRGKREIWRVQMSLSKIRTAARTLLTMDEKDPKRIFEGEALLRRMYRYGLLVRPPAQPSTLGLELLPAARRVLRPLCQLSACRLRGRLRRTDSRLREPAHVPHRLAVQPAGPPSLLLLCRRSAASL